MINSKIKKKKINFHLKHILLINLIILLGVLIIDYYDCFYWISRKLNFAFLNIFANALVIVTMFLVTYNVVEKKTMKINLERKKNKSDVLYALLFKAYNDCITTLDLVNDPKIFNKFIISKSDSNSIDKSMLDAWFDSPFECYNQIINLMQDGVADKDRLVNYLEIKSLFGVYINQKVVFFNNKVVEKNIEAKDFINSFSQKIKMDLEEKIDSEIKKLHMKLEEK